MKRTLQTQVVQKSADPPAPDHAVQPVINVRIHGDGKFPGSRERLLSTIYTVISTPNASKAEPGA
jgi:hypothetical protein